jgi:hypothetical protein
MYYNVCAYHKKLNKGTTETLERLEGKLKAIPRDSKGK